MVECCSGHIVDVTSRKSNHIQPGMMLFLKAFSTGDFGSPIRSDSVLFQVGWARVGRTLVLAPSMRSKGGALLGIRCPKWRSSVIFGILCCLALHHSWLCCGSVELSSVLVVSEVCSYLNWTF